MEPLPGINALPIAQQIKRRFDGAFDLLPQRHFVRIGIKAG